jgi:hypothetical protein
MAQCRGPGSRVTACGWSRRRSRKRNTDLGEAGGLKTCECRPAAPPPGSVRRVKRLAALEEIQEGPPELLVPGRLLGTGLHEHVHVAEGHSISRSLLESSRSTPGSGGPASQTGLLLPVPLRSRTNRGSVRGRSAGPLRRSRGHRTARRGAATAPKKTGPGESILLAPDSTSIRLSKVDEMGGGGPRTRAAARHLPSSLPHPGHRLLGPERPGLPGEPGFPVTAPRRGHPSSVDAVGRPARKPDAAPFN